MNELEKQLSVILEKAINVAEQTGEFAIEQAPLLLQEFYQWHIVKSILMIAVFFWIMLVFRLISLKFGTKDESKIPEKSKINYVEKPNGRFYLRSYSYDDECYGYSAYIAFNIVKYLPLIGVCYWLYNLVFIVVAPKLYLIDYFVK